MKKTLLGLAAIAALGAALGAAVAQDSSGVFLKGQEEGQWLARDLYITAKVYNKDGQIIGDIEDLVFNADNEIEGVIMGTGGFVGLGEKQVGVRITALQVEEKDGKRILVLPEATKETLDALAAYERKTPPKSMLDRAMEKAKELTDKTAVTTKDAYEKAREQAAPVIEKAQEAAKEAYDKAKEAMAAKEAPPPAPAAPETPAAAPDAAAPAAPPETPAPAAPETPAPTP